MEDHKGRGHKAQGEDDTDGMGQADPNLPAGEESLVEKLSADHLHKFLVQLQLSVVHRMVDQFDPVLKLIPINLRGSVDGILIMTMLG